MSALFGVIAIPLGWIMKACYLLVRNYGIALILFTIIIRLLLLPLNIKQQKSSFSRSCKSFRRSMQTIRRSIRRR